MSYDMLKLLDRLQVDRVDVVGWSDGGIIGLELAIHHPKRIRRLVAISANYDVKGLLQTSTADTEIRRVPLRYKLLARDPAHWPALYRKVVTMWQTQPHYTLSDLENVKVPTLIMAGEFDIIKHDQGKRTEARDLLVPIYGWQKFDATPPTHYLQGMLGTRGRRRFCTS